MPWDLRGLELGKDLATLGQACFLWQMECVGCEWITKPNQKDNILLYGNASHSTFHMHVVLLESKGRALHKGLGL